MIVSLFRSLREGSLEVLVLEVGVDGVGWLVRDVGVVMVSEVREVCLRFGRRCTGRFCAVQSSYIYQSPKC